ncbi:muscle M-line assembly protein unc-89 isoform X3 [Synchiropus splendidus]|uniref:muscle M-line assembly protein unc-89 isoform X3 n=2 Tax=Synchiropus splendidus TaxID=270530 RepID=UPI00237D9715|nr:muscle M-line assembly protein unc-89 isoform X3 [Synchiropus splendidus]
MAQKYPSVKRPRRKLFGNVEKWAAKPSARKLTLEDVDGMFDDIDSGDFPSLVLDSSNESKITPKGTTQPPVSKMLQKECTAPSPEQNIGSEVPFKEHGPVKTSSPIESSASVIREAEQSSSFSPILLHVDEDEEELHLVKTARSKPVASPVPQLNGSFSERTESPVVQQETSENQQKSISTKTESGPSSEESKSPSLEKTPVKTSHLGRETTPFLQKLKEVGQTKLTRSRKQLTPVKVPPPPRPEPDDDFLILDVDDPLWITIPKKNASNQIKSKTSSHDCTVERRSSPETAPKEEAPKAVVQSLKKKGKLSKRQSAPVESVDDVLVNNDKPNKKRKQPLVKTSSKETETVEGPVGGKRDKVHSPETKKLAKMKVTHTTESLTKTRKEKHTSEGEKNVSDHAVENIHDPQSDVHREDLDSVPEEELMKSPTNKGGRPTKSSSAPDGNHIESCQILEKRKRNPPKEFWLVSPQDTPEPESKDESPVVMSKQNTAKPSSPVKKSQAVLKRGKNGTVSETQSCDKKDNKRSKNKRIKNSLIQDRVQEQKNLVLPSPSQPSDHSTHLGDQQANSHQLLSPSRDKRKRKPPGEWWKVDALEEAETSPPDLPSSTAIKPSKEREAHPKQIGGSGQLTVKSGRRASKPVGGALVSRLSQSRKPLKSIPKSTRQTPSGALQRHRYQDEAELPASGSKVTLIQRNGRSACKVIVQDESSGDEGLNNTFDVCLSGPSSRIDLDVYEDSDLSSSQMPPAELSMSDLCAPPLKPMVLQPVDRTNLTRWLMSLWSSPAVDSDNVASILEQFQWFFYQHRALGVMEDCNNGTVSSGMFILGSYMKKPLWVDHSATTVFHLSTSTLKVTVDLQESCYIPGHSFIVPCGHAYSIQNLTTLPAALFFTRMQTQSPG